MTTLFQDDVGDQLCERVLGVLYQIWLIACVKSFPGYLNSGLCFSCKLISILNRSDIVEDLSRDVYELASQIRPDRSVE